LKKVSEIPSIERQLKSLKLKINKKYKPKKIKKNQTKEIKKGLEDIQKDLDDIKSAMRFIQEKISAIEKSPASQNGNGNNK